MGGDDFTHFLNGDFLYSIFKFWRGFNARCLWCLRVIISFMLGKAISNSLRQTNMTNLIIVIGSLLFFISDFMLMLKSFADLPVAGYLCLGTYYPAQFLLAFSLFVYPSTSMKFLNHKKGTMSLQTSYQKLKVGYDYD